MAYLNPLLVSRGQKVKCLSNISGSRDSNPNSEHVEANTLFDKSSVCFDLIPYFREIDHDEPVFSEPNRLFSSS